MNLLRTLNGVALLGLAGASLSGCLQAPDYPDTPEIDFKEAKVVSTPRSGNVSATTTITFVLNFRDGDGDLGLSQEDIRTAPYNQAARPAAAARNHTTNEFNYYIQPYVKVNGVFVPFTNPNSRIGEYDATYPRLDGSNAKPSPLKGELNYTFPITIDEFIFNTGDVFKFELTILDRQLHVSNTVTSSEVILGR